MRNLKRKDLLSESLFPLKNKSTNGDNVTRYSIIHKDGSETDYVWCDKTKQMVVKETTIMEAVIYSNGNQECERAKTLLENLNFQISVYKLNQHFSQRGFVAEFGEEAEYPQVNVGFRHIGGLKDTLNYFKDNNIL